MILKKLTLALLLMLGGVQLTIAQNLVQVNIRATDRDAQVHSIVVSIGNQHVCIDLKGRIRFNEAEQAQNDYEYWDTFGGRYRNGKIKKMGSLQIDYYDEFAWDEISGKVKSIGGIPITYYDHFGLDETQGKIKSFGNITFTYYDRFGFEAMDGKVKTIGNYPVAYFTRFDADKNEGKLKTIGNNIFAYNDSYSQQHPGGLSIKGDNPRLCILKDED